MIGPICLATEPLIPLNNATFILQTPDPWTTFFIQMFAVIAGGIIALMANYALQKQRFKAENETNRNNRRTDAYIDLLGAIFRYESTSKIDEDLRFHAIKAYIYGSPTVSKEINAWFSNISVNGDFRKSADLVRLIIMTEMGIDQMIEKKARGKSEGGP